MWPFEDDLISPWRNVRSHTKVQFINMNKQCTCLVPVTANVLHEKTPIIMINDAYQTFLITYCLHCLSIRWDINALLQAHRSPSRKSLEDSMYKLVAKDFQLRLSFLVVSCMTCNWKEWGSEGSDNLSGNEHGRKPPLPQSPSISPFLWLSLFHWDFTSYWIPRWHTEKGLVIQHNKMD